ncbi:MAG: hypothetical protein ACRCTI_20275 [Beijerinckiaceae bacterium]
MHIDYDQMHAQYEADRLRRAEARAGGSPVLGWVIIGLFLAWALAEGMKGL